MPRRQDVVGRATSLATASNLAPARRAFFGVVESDRPHAADRDHRWLFGAPLYAIVVRRAGDATDEAAGWHRDRRIRIELGAAGDPPRSRDHDAISILLVPVRCAHVAGIPFDEIIIEPRFRRLAPQVCRFHDFWRAVACHLPG